MANSPQMHTYNRNSILNAVVVNEIVPIAVVEKGREERLWFATGLHEPLIIGKPNGTITSQWIQVDEGENAKESCRQTEPTLEDVRYVTEVALETIQTIKLLKDNGDAPVNGKLLETW